ncbi:hypothetical protein M0R45_002226 [Rubus argutus]|uniref:Uncharacterized protein n=1 Tax=Rubus argutus TaxID=59490 RepID=A0AAW1VDM7_RUBAR
MGFWAGDHGGATRRRLKRAAARLGLGCLREMKVRPRLSGRDSSTGRRCGAGAAVKKDGFGCRWQWYRRLRGLRKRGDWVVLRDDDEMTRA